MNLEENIEKLENKNCMAVKLFYDTVRNLVSRVGYTRLGQNFFGIEKEFVGVRKSPEEFLRLVRKRPNLRNVTFIEVFTAPDKTVLRALTGYSDLQEFLDKHFSYYAIGCTSNLGCGFEPIVREKVLDADKRRIAQLDFDNCRLTKVGEHYFFTLSSLYELVKDAKPFLRPHFDYKC
ncbi:MAG: hypothetical protein ABIH63_02065 [archaeon]